MKSAEGTERSISFTVSPILLDGHYEGLSVIARYAAKQKTASADATWLNGSDRTWFSRTCRFETRAGWS
ncbi:hypothetical protein [Salinispira pacifica]